jgi:hypothetical protein
MLIQPILVVTFINFICAAIGWGVINNKKENANRVGSDPKTKTDKLTDDENAARKMMISNLFLSLGALALAGLCYLAETGTKFPGSDLIVQHGKWAVLGLMVINLGLSAGAFAKINSADACVTEGYLKHSRNSMLVNVVLGLLGALFVFDKVPTFTSGADISAAGMLASVKGLFNRSDAAAAPAQVATA